MRFLLALLAITVISCSYKSYDYIIVGGGASGSVASVELSKKFPESSVLLLERGMSDLEAPDTHRMDAWPTLLMNSEILESVRYKDGVWTMLGHVLSGGSGLNAGIMGQEKDEFFTEAFGFNDTQNKKIREMYDKLYDELSHKTILSELGQDLINAAEEMGLNNTGYQHGYVKKNTTFQTYSAFDMNTNTRNTTADYMRNHINRGEIPNLTVQTRSLVTRFIISNEGQIAGVSVMNHGVNEIIVCRKSVILSAGAIKSTQLLQVSGIGDEPELKEAGIPARIVNAEVGKGYIDRILESTCQFSPLDIKIPLTPISSLSVEDGLLEERTSGGKVSSGFSIMMGVLLQPPLRSTINLGLFKVFLENYPLLHKCVDNSIQINILVANPTSRGYIKATSPNIVDTPEIDPKFLDTEEDKKASARARQKSLDYYETKSLKKYARKSGSGPSFECGLLMEFPAQVTSNRASSLHLFGGVTWGKAVGKDFRVNNIDNLYVIDASMYPRATEINPFNTIAAVGGFIAQEFVAAPERAPVMPARVQLTNKQEPNKCMAIGSPIYASDCVNMHKDTMLWIQDAETGKYTTEPKENTAYLLRSANDDRYCMYHYLGGLTTQDMCTNKWGNQKVYFVKKDEFYQVRFNMSVDTGPCMMKWWGSNTVSGFSCSFPQTDRLQWKVKVLSDI